MRKCLLKGTSLNGISKSITKHIKANGPSIQSGSHFLQYKVLFSNCQNIKIADWNKKNWERSAKIENIRRFECTAPVGALKSSMDAFWTCNFFLKKFDFKFCSFTLAHVLVFCVKGYLPAIEQKFLLSGFSVHIHDFGRYDMKMASSQPPPTCIYSTNIHFDCRHTQQLLP